MHEQIDAIDEDSIFIAHSLGTVAALHYLSRELKQQKIQQLVLIAGFNGRLGRLDEVNPFIDAAEIDFDLLKQQVAERVVIYPKEMTGLHQNLVWNRRTVLMQLW